jgi:4-amino-4-deoxy-L-arabinose transferase-like glycosyltransferase
VTAIPFETKEPRAAGAAGSRKSRLLRAHPADPAWARPALAGLLLATALLYLVGLDRNGWGNEFYAAAVQAGTKSWKAFLFGSLDSSSFITVDKPAGFLWVMEISARIFGFNYWSLLVPQALAGVATVGVLYTTVRRWFGPPAALVAGAVMALAPVATLMFRFDDPDALMTLMITLAAYAVTRSVESGRTRWIVFTGVFLGAGFLSKMLAAFMVLPALALVYLWAGPPKLGKRIWQLLVGGVAVVVSSGWWVLVVLLTPAADRPFVGSSTNNNILNLIFVYNGFGRLTGNERGGGAGFGGAAPVTEPAAGAAGGTAGAADAAGRAAGAAGRGFTGGGFGGSGGITRLFSAQYGGQVAWLIPAALIAVLVMLWVSRRAPRTDRTRAAALLWGGWLVVAGLVLSFMSGISHTYYVVALTPAVGALVGIGAAKLWEVRGSWFARTALAAVLLLTGGWAWVLLDRSPGWFPWLRWVIVVAALAAAGLVLAGFALRARTAGSRSLLGALPVSLALVAGLGGPLAFSIDTAASASGGASPSAGPAVTSARGGLAGRGVFGAAGAAGGTAGRFGRDGFAGAGRGAAGGTTGDGTADGGTAGGGTAGGGTAGGLGGAARAGGFGGSTSISAALAKLLETDASGYKWVAATSGSDSAAAMELGTGGDPVMAIGGFSGSDPTPTLAAFEQMVAARQVHYFVLSGGGAAGGFGGAGGRPGNDVSGEANPGTRATGRAASDSAQVEAWVESHFTAETVGGSTVYDLTAPKSGS